MKNLLNFLLLMSIINTSWAEATKASKTSEDQWVSIQVNGYQLKGKYTAAPTTFKDQTAKPAILIIAGSGPTDHNGNSTKMGLINNSYLMLSQALNAQGHATLRVDKRGIGESASEQLDMAKVTFQEYVNDVMSWANYLKQNHQQVIVIGHSLGGLMSIQAAQNTQIDQLITIASMSDTMYKTLKRQLGDQPEFVSKAAYPLLERLANNESIPADEVPPYLNALFHPKLQEYIKSFLMIDPHHELSKIDIPTLAIIGDTDIQVTVEETHRLVDKSPHVQLRVIKGMNHVMKNSPLERMANIATYSQPDLPLHDELIPTILKFIEEQKR